MADIVDLFVDPKTGKFTTADEPDRGKRPPRSDARQMVDQVDRRWAWTIVRIFFTIFVFMTIVWAADFYGNPGIQIMLFYVTLILLVAMAISVKVTGAIFGLGSMLGREKGQSLFQAGSDELKSWWTKGAPGAILAIMLFQGFFILWPWSYTFGLFWMAVGAGIIFGVCMFVYAIPSTWTPKIVLPIAALVAILTMFLSMLGVGLMSNIEPVTVKDIPLIGNKSATAAPIAPPAPKFATADRSELGNFAPIRLVPGEGMVVTKFADDALCYFEIPGLTISSLMKDSTIWKPGFDKDAWQLQFVNQGTETIGLQLWRQSGTICSRPVL